MVKNICQESQPMDNPLFRNVPRVGFLSLSEKVKLLPLIPTSASRLLLSKTNELLCGREALHILLHFPAKYFQNAMIQWPASDKVDEFHGH
jgi:hypothetical protein